MDTSLSKPLCQSLVDSLDEVQSVQIGRSGNVVGTSDTDCQVFCHLTVLNSFNGC